MFSGFAWPAFLVRHQAMVPAEPLVNSVDGMRRPPRQ
jgi:hypothetical protein